MINYSQIKLKDIAKATGYSVNTISRALRDMPDIATETKQVIAEKAKKMGYVPNKNAASLRTRKSMTIGIIIPKLHYPIYSYILTELAFIVSKAGYSLLFLHPSGTKNDVCDEIHAACEYGVDGIILMTPFSDLTKESQILTSLSMPFVFLGEISSGAVCDTVTFNNEASIYQLTNYILSKGHRNVVYISPDSSLPVVQTRMRGFQKAMLDAGLNGPEHIFLAENPFESREWLSACAEAHPDATAFIAYNDMLALLLMDYFICNGTRVPDDVSIAGFDHVQSYFMPMKKLTSVDTNLENIANKAVDIILKKIKGDLSLSEEYHIILPTTFIEGDTVCEIMPE